MPIKIPSPRKCKCGWKLTVVYGDKADPLLAKCDNWECEFEWNKKSGETLDYALEQWPKLSAPKWYTDLPKDHPFRAPLVVESEDKKKHSLRTANELQ